MSGSRTSPSKRVIAFYLPQYHPTQENSEWWGKGFTEWVNVSKTRPRFSGHYQPHIPADLGFYDLRLSQSRADQAELAKRFGIHGFCYYHYWFKGRRVLSTPLDEVLRSQEPNFPFCLCWANEDWTRTWDGRGKTVLIKQEYSDEDDHLHMEWLKGVFGDPRYIRVDGKPLFLVYRAGRLPSPSRTAATWRKAAKELGIGEIYLCRVESFLDERGDPADIGFDATVEFQPDWANLGTPARVVEQSRQTLYGYADFVQRQMTKAAVPYKLHRCVTPSWDNSPRRSVGALTLTDADPNTFRDWFEDVFVTEHMKGGCGDSLIFVNAWNEWGEGCHLEPDRRFGTAFLQAISDVIRGQPKETWHNRQQPEETTSATEQTGHDAPTTVPYSYLRSEETLGPTPPISHRDELQDRLQTAEQNVSYLEERLHLAQSEINRMRSTVSWRITAPLRALRNTIIAPLLRLLKDVPKTEQKPQEKS